MIRCSDAEPEPLITQVIRWQFAEGQISRDEHDRQLAEAAKREAADRARLMADRAEDLMRRSSLNPKVTLDSGGVVWGCKCWWSEADDSTPQERAKGRRIVIVSAPHPAEEMTTDA